MLGSSYDLTVKQTRNQNITKFRHSTKNEPPFPVELALMLHAKTRKRKLVDSFAEEGLCISYDRVLDIREKICGQICLEYENNNQVCPPLL